MDTNDFVLDEDFDFHSFTNLGPVIENNFSYWLGVIWNYVKKGYSCIKATNEDPNNVSKSFPFFPKYLHRFPFLNLFSFQQIHSFTLF